MASKQVLGSDKILRINDEALLGMVQSSDWSPNFNAQDIYEMGKQTKLTTAMELETSGTISVQSIGGLPGILARMIVTRNSGNFTGYMYASGGAGGKNQYTITEASLTEAVFDLTIHERTDQLTFDRSTVLPRCFLASVSGRADANGQASETINWQGDFVAGCPTPYHDVRTVPLTWASSSTLTIPTYGATHTVLYLFINERRVLLNAAVPGTATAVFCGQATATITVPTGTTITQADVCKAVVYKTATPAATFPTMADSDRSTTAYYMRGWQISMFLLAAAGDPLNPTVAEQMLKVQSADWSIDLQLEALRQLAFSGAGNAVYYRAVKLPMSVSVNASVLESDWTDWKAVLDPTVKSTIGTGTTVAQMYTSTYDFAPASLRDSFKLVMTYATKAGSIVQRLAFNDLRVDGSGRRAAVQGRGEISWSFKGTSFTMNGYNL